MRFYRLLFSIVFALLCCTSIAQIPIKLKESRKVKVSVRPYMVLTEAGSMIRTVETMQRVKGFTLLPHQFMVYKESSDTGRIKPPTDISIVNVVSKEVIDNKIDSLKKEAYQLATEIKDRFHFHDNQSLVSVNISYYDKRRFDVGKSLQCTYAILGGKIKKGIEVSFPGAASLVIDSAVNSRLDSFKLADNEFIMHDTANYTMKLCRIMDYKKQKPSTDKMTPERKDMIKMIYEILQDKFYKYYMVSVYYIEPKGLSEPMMAATEIEKLNLFQNYQDLKQLYYEVTQPVSEKPELETYSFAERLNLFGRSRPYYNAPNAFNNPETGKAGVTLRYYYPAGLLNTRLDSIVGAMSNETPLFINFVAGDTMKTIDYIEYCFLKSGVKSDPYECFYGGEIKIEDEKPIASNDDVSKAKIFAQSLNTIVSVDSTADELLFRWNIHYGTDFNVKGFYEYLTRRWARLLYVYILKGSKKYTGCGFIITNTNERGEQKTLEYHYKKGDRLFATIKAFLSRPDDE